MPIQGDSRLTIALERPGGSADQGVYKDRIELQGVSPRFPCPDFSAEYRFARKWGYVELAGIARRIEWVDQNTDTFNLSGGVWGWGLNFSTNLKLGKKVVFRGQALYGEGIENYMNDAPVDISIKNDADNKTTPIKGVAVPVLGLVAFFDINWNAKFSTSIGYSSVDISNSDGQAPNAFKRGDYAAANIMFYPVKNAMVGIEWQYGTRENYTDGWSTNINKVQASFKYNFSQTFFKKQG
jgi:hypothetical protein